MFQIKPVRSAADLEATVQLFNASASSVGVDLSYQDFATELATLPGKYATLAGELLLARDSRGKPLGCVGLRPIKPHGCCEIKRLYVSPEARGLALGRALIAAIIEEAVRIGQRNAAGYSADHRPPLQRQAMAEGTKYPALTDEEIAAA